MAQEQGVWRALHTCVIFMRSCCVLLDSPRLSLLLFAFHLLSHLPFHFPDHLHLHLPCGRQEPCAPLRLRTLAPLPSTTLSQVMSPTTSTSQRLLIYSSRSPSGDSRPSSLHDLEFDDYTIGMALSSPLFTQERDDAASRRQAYHTPEESLLSSQSSSVGHVRPGDLLKSLVL